MRGSGPIVFWIVLVSLVGAAAACVAKPSRPAVADCFRNEVLDDSAWKPLACTDPEAVLQYAAVVDSSGNCPDSKGTDSTYLSLDRDGTRLCFILNLFGGHCYASFRNDESLRPVDCEAPGKSIRVVKRVDGKNDESLCPNGTHPVAFPDPKRTYCTESYGAI